MEARVYWPKPVVIHLMWKPSAGWMSAGNLHNYAFTLCGSVCRTWADLPLSSDGQIQPRKPYD